VRAFRGPAPMIGNRESGRGSLDPVFVGFDLDMTLLDTRPGIAATCRALTERTGVHIDADAVVSRLGPPLAQELARWFPTSDVPGAVDLYRLLYRDHAITPSRPPTRRT
jgi:phosphoglycolate phosphatase